MTRPVPIVEGFYFVTRRTHGGTFRLRPSKFTNRLLRFLVAAAAVRYDVQVIAFSVMPTTDPAQLHMTQARRDLRQARQSPTTRNVELRTRILRWFSDFVQTYGATRQRWQHNNEKRGPAPLFPYGTNLLRTTFGVCCGPRPEDCPVPQLA